MGWLGWRSLTPQKMLSNSNSESWNTSNKKKKARLLAVPTKDPLVKARLRELGEPICLFGENAGDRRQRLRMVMVQLGVTEGMPKIALEEQRVFVDRSVDDSKKVYYTPGSRDLKEFRLWCLRTSIPCAKKRVAGQKAQREIENEGAMQKEDEPSSKRMRTGPSPDATTAMKQVNDLKGFVNLSSQVDDAKGARPLSSVSFSPDGTMLASSSWSGSVKLWNVETFEQKTNYRGHTERANNVIFHPSSTRTASPDSLNFLSCGADKQIHLWSLTSSTPIATLSGHVDRVNRLALHPLGNHLASTSHDMTWRLWDLETKKMILEQEGHSRPVYGVAFHPDGSLVCTTGLDSFGRVWDLRSGKSIFLMKGHVSSVLTTDWASDGFTFASGGDDHSVRIWDLRRKRCAYTIPAHSKVVSQVKFFGQKDYFLVTSSFDQSVKLWTGDWTLIKVLSGHEGQVSGVDISFDASLIASCGFDKTWKIWKKEHIFLGDDEGLSA